MQPEFLIIGQGLAGSLLGWTLHNQGREILIVDSGAENASRIAAGLINPVTGKRLVKTTGIDSMLPAARHFYQQLGHFFHRDFLRFKPMLRLLRSQHERDLALQRLQHPEYQTYLNYPADTKKGLNSPFGLLPQLQTATLLTQPLLDTLHTFFLAQGKLISSTVKHTEIEPAKATWRDIKADKIIFCEGHLMTKNPWFNWLPLQPVKGEILTACAEHLPCSEMLNYGHWMIPLDDQQFKTGATFDHQHLDTLPTYAARDLLTASLQQACPTVTAVSVQNHQAGIRPATQDRQPYIGLHPTYHKLAIFNGFGAKGSLLIPFYSQIFTDFLLGKIDQIPFDTNINRHYETYFPA